MADVLSNDGWNRLERQAFVQPLNDSVRLWDGEGQMIGEQKGRGDNRPTVRSANSRGMTSWDMGRKVSASGNRTAPPNS